MKNRLFACLPALLLATCTFGQQSIYLPWEFAGGPPCPVNEVLLHQGVLYAATDCGLYKRPENGGIWQQQPNTPEGTVLFLAANAGAIVAVFNQKIYQWTYGHQVLDIFNSTDNGASFQQRHSYEHNFWTSSGNPHASGPDFINRLYALGDSSFVLSVRTCPLGCSYLQIGSTDLGEHWDQRYVPTYNWARAVNAYTVRADTVAVFNDDSLKIFQAADLQQLAAVAIPFGNSTDRAAGLAWVNNRFTVTFEDGRYAYSDDGGQHWETGTLPFSGVNDFFYYDNFYYWCSDAGFYRSAGVGPVTLDTIYTNTSVLRSVSKARRGTGGWYLLVRKVLLWLPDDSNEVTPVSTQGMKAAKGQVSSLPGRLMFRTEDGLWWELPDGADWKVYENATAYEQSFENFITIDSSSLAISKPTTTGSFPGIYRSVDGGLTWSVSASYPNFSSSESRFLKNQLDDRIYLGRFFTADGGLSWQTIPQGAPIAALGDTLLLRSALNDRISFDHGQNWQMINSPNPSNSYHFVLANRALFALPSYPGSLIFRSTDFGATWNAMGAGSIYYGTQVPVVTSRAGQTTWLEGEQTLSVIADSSQQYFRINTPFSGVIAFPNFAHPAFGRIVEKDSTIYAAYNGGIWRIPSCYTDHPFSTPVQETTICQGNFILFHGDTLRTPGTYIRTVPGFTTVCDSVDVLQLKVNLIKTSWNRTICAGDTVTWNGQAYSQVGNYTQQFSTPTHCDSLVTLNLKYYQTAGTQSRPFCAGDTISLHGDTITAPGTYTYSFTSFAGCDSTLTVSVYNAQSTYYYSPSICEGASYSLYGHTYTETGEYSFLRPEPFSPCPAIHRISLMVIPDEVITLDTFVAVGAIIYGQFIQSDTTLGILVAGPNNCDKKLIINVHAIVGLDELNQQPRVQAFPNPFQDQLTFRWPDGETARLRLYDAQGKLCREARSAGPAVTWEMEKWPAGFYRVEMTVSGRQYAWKLVKQ